MMVLFGWTGDQFIKAAGYYNQCNKTDLDGLKAFESALISNGSDMEDAKSIFAFWRSRRADNPGEISIVIP